ncbi:hypothetical protein [Maritimibacter dapengensis]|nr:hypothetical protein [Maritimibacter dapengensis]
MLIRAIMGLVLSVVALPAVAENVGFRFLWEGASGFEMVGALAFDESLMSEPVIYEGDLACFEIEGRQDGDAIGRFALDMVTLETDWRLTFLPGQGAFAVYSLATPTPQEWNMDGLGTSCGEGGFGFNIGNYAQDLCLDGKLLIASQMPPRTPFPAVRDDAVTFSPDACRDAMMLSALE